MPFRKGDRGDVREALKEFVKENYAIASEKIGIHSVVIEIFIRGQTNLKNKGSRHIY